MKNLLKNNLNKYDIVMLFLSITLFMFEIINNNGALGLWYVTIYLMIIVNIKCLINKKNIIGAGVSLMGYSLTSIGQGNLNQFYVLFFIGLIFVTTSMIVSHSKKEDIPIVDITISTIFIIIFSFISNKKSIGGLEISILLILFITLKYAVITSYIRESKTNRSINFKNLVFSYIALVIMLYIRFLK